MSEKYYKMCCYTLTFWCYGVMLMGLHVLLLQRS